MNKTAKRWLTAVLWMVIFAWICHTAFSFYRKFVVVTGEMKSDLAVRKIVNDAHARALLVEWARQLDRTDSTKDQLNPETGNLVKGNITYRWSSEATVLPADVEKLIAESVKTAEIRVLVVKGKFIRVGINRSAVVIQTGGDTPMTECSGSPLFGGPEVYGILCRD